MNTKRLFPALFAMILIAGAFVAFSPVVSACNTSTISVSNDDGDSWSKVYGPDGNNGDTTRYVTYGKTTDIERGGTADFKFRIHITPGCGSYYEVMFKTNYKPDGWTVKITDATSGVGKTVGSDIDGVKMGSLDTPKEGFQDTVTYICDVVVTASIDANLGTTGNYVEIEVYSEDRACNDEDHIFVKLPFRVVERHDPPVVTISAPLPDIMASMSLDVTYTAHDTETADQDLNVNLLIKQKGTTQWQTALRPLGNGGDDVTVTWDCSKIEDGEWDLRIEAFDTGVPQKSGWAVVPIEINNPNRPEIWITSPDPTQSEIFQNEIPIRWQATDEEEDDEDLLIDLFYTTEGTMDWFEIVLDETNDGEYLWNISEMEDRPDYRIKAIAKDSTEREGEYITPYKHTINNLDGPVVSMVYPTGGQTFSGDFVIYWQASDSDGDPLSITLEWSEDAGETWEILAEDLPNCAPCSYAMDSWQYEDADQYMVKVTADDGNMQGYKTCEEPFAIFNNDEPELEITYPKTGEKHSGIIMIEWDADDPEDGEEGLMADVYYKKGLSTYESLVNGVPNEGHYEWDTTSSIDFTDTIYGIKVVVTDSHLAVAQQEVEGFEIYNPDVPVLDVEKPEDEETIKGKYAIRWACEDPDEDEVLISFYYSSDMITWNPIAENEVNDDGQVWDTNNVPDGLYHLKITATDGELTAETIIKNITILNYVNYEPTLEILTPTYDQEISGTYQILWSAADDNAEDVLKVSIGYSQNLATYTNFAEDLENTGSYSWDTLTMEDGEYTLKITVTDGAGGEISEVSKRFFIKNEENPEDPADPGDPGDSKEAGGSSSGLIIGIIVAIVILLAVLAVVIFLFIRGSKSDDGVIDPLKQPLPIGPNSNQMTLQGVEQGALPSKPDNTLPPPNTGMPPA